MTKLSVNINKIATLRNARGKNMPNVAQVAIDCELFGADGITVHPRPDQRHITRADVLELKKVVSTEFNIEGYPNKKFLELVKKVKPAQVTLVPDAPGVLTSNAGWNTKKHHKTLKKTIAELKKNGMRVSLFLAPDLEMLEYAVLTGADRVEFYTEDFAANFIKAKVKAVKPYVTAAKKATELKLGINAGHDLNLQNLNYFVKNVPNVLEVSIGHALICDSLYYGLENTIKMYKRQLIV